MAGLTLAWGAVIALIGVSGDFPLNDDWAYARATLTFLETGRLERVGITWTPLFTHVALGSLFASLFGFSFEVLRACGLFMGWLGMLGTFVLCRGLGASALPAALGAAVVGFNPLHVSLAFTFMTDVPFTALATWSLVGWVFGITRRSPAALAAAVVLAVAATLSRQPGAALLVGPAALLVAMRLRRPRVWLVAGAAAALAGALLAGFPALFGASDQGHLFELGDLWQRIRSPSAAFHVARNVLGSLIYLGLFLAPATLCFVPARGAGRRVAWSIALAALPLAALAFTALRMPLAVNMMHGFRLGTLAMDGAETLPAMPPVLGWVVAGLGSALGFLALGRLAALHVRGWRPERLVLLAFAVLYLGVLGLVWPFFERWWLPVVPPLTALLLVPEAAAAGASRPLRAAGAALLVVLAVYGVAGTRDHLALQRARWELLDGLLEAGVSPARIDGGFEFGGWFNYHPDPRRFQARRRRWVVDDEYRVSLGGTPPGYREVASRSVTRWLPPGREKVWLYRRHPERHRESSPVPEAPQRARPKEPERPPRPGTDG